ncbi:MAG: phosphatase PAP2 family protein [Nocardioides sp.]
MWPTWDEAAIACCLALLIWASARWGMARLVPQGYAEDGRLHRVRYAVAAAALEFSVVSALYGVWRLARQLPFTQEAGAVDRARAIDDLQHHLGLPSELALQHFVIQWQWLAATVNAYYAIVHVPALITFLIWMWIRHRDRYRFWRNNLVLVTLGCLLIRFIRVAPPRFVPELGFVNLADHLGLDIYGDPGRGVSDQYAAMPSIHVAWAAIVALGVFASTRSRWRWVIVLHLPITLVVVAATGHHWWLDGIVALGLLWLAVLIQRALTPLSRSVQPQEPRTASR